MHEVRLGVSENIGKNTEIKSSQHTQHSIGENKNGLELKSRCREDVVVEEEVAFSPQQEQ